MRCDHVAKFWPKLLGGNSVGLLKGREKAKLFSFWSFHFLLPGPCLAYENNNGAPAIFLDNVTSNEEEQQVVEGQIKGA